MSFTKPPPVVRFSKYKKLTVHIKGFPGKKEFLKTSKWLQSYNPRKTGCQMQKTACEIYATKYVFL